MFFFACNSIQTMYGWAPSHVLGVSELTVAPPTDVHPSKMVSVEKSPKRHAHFSLLLYTIY